MSNTLTIATGSAKRFVPLMMHHELHADRRAVGHLYVIDGQPYRIFRATEKYSTDGNIEILVIGFRLRLIRSSKLLHWLFQRICIITTPFWSGMPGFKTKLWMVSDTQDYLGIYDWRGDAESRGYLRFLLPVLRLFSVSNSVWTRRFNNITLPDYLSVHELRLPAS